MGMNESKGSPSCSKARELGVRGLSNCSLSCCVNALLQSFAATTELQELLSRWKPSDESHAYNVPLRLKKALEAMKDKMQTSPHLEFLECLHHNQICRLTQHDADEVFHAVLNLIQEQMSDQEIAAAIKNLYKIEVEGCCQCLNCENVHRVANLFLSFPLHLPERGNTLEDCFKMFFESQKLEGSDSFYCVRCERKTPTVQGCKLVSLPPILCINLKRFRNNNGFTRKLNTKVSFPETINMAEMLPKERSQATEKRYRLYAVIVHAGMATVGHYTAFIYSTDCKWYYTNDSVVRQLSKGRGEVPDGWELAKKKTLIATMVTWEEVQRTYGGRELLRGNAYMLLYRALSSEASQESLR